MDVSVRVFLNEINIWIIRLSKAEFSPYVGGPHSQLKAHVQRKS